MFLRYRQSIVQQNGQLYQIRVENFMRKYTLFSGIILILLTACHSEYTDNAILLKAESVLNAHPDSAYRLLSGIKNPEKLSDSDYAAWCLHYTHAQYKLYMDIKSDSLVKIALNYYTRTHLKKYSGTSYYLQGCILELLQRYNEAMLAYKKAVAELDQTKEYNTRGLATINMGYIYEQERNYYQAYVCAKKSLEYFELSGNIKYRASAYHTLSNMLLQLDHPLDSILFYSNKALNLAKEANDSILYYTILSRQGEFLEKENPEQAINCLLAGFSHCPNRKIRNALYLAYLYSKLNKPDSASFYLKKSDKQKGDTELEILRNLASAGVFEGHKDYKQAYYQIEKAYINQDSVYREKVRNQSYAIDRQFDLSEKEKENASLKIANQTRAIFIAALLIVVLLILLLYQRKNSRNKERHAFLEIKHQKLEFELRKQELENRRKHDLLLAALQQRIEMTLRFNKLQQGVFNPQKQEEFIETMLNQVLLTKSEWQYYIDETNNLFDDKIAALKKTHTDLTPSDLIVIVLISLGINIVDSCTLLHSSKETMYARRKRIKKHLNLSNEVDLEQWVRENIG